MPQIKPIDIIAPGSAGLNSERGATLLHPNWATVAQNAVVHAIGRLATRKGWVSQTTNAITDTPPIAILHEYISKDGVSRILVSAERSIFSDTNDFTDAAKDITASTPASKPYWQFVNFNDRVLGFQRGEAPIEWPGAGAFEAIEYIGTGPDGHCAAAAFGRVWAADTDLQTIRYSALLDHTDYTGASGGGTIDMSSVWTSNMDRIVAIKAIGASLVVFGENHIIMWADRSGSELGLDPAELEVVDTIEGTGCIARDSIQITGEGDLIFLSRHGLQSLGRVIASKSNPTVALSKNVRTEIDRSIHTQRRVDPELDQVQSLTSPEEGLYLVNFPGEDKQYALDLRHPFEDDDGAIVFPITTWALGGAIKALLATISGDIFFGSAGVVGKYAGLYDNGNTYVFDFATGWLDFADYNHHLKILKEIIASVAINRGTVTYYWEFDFNNTELSRVVSYRGRPQAEYGTAEYNGYIDPDNPGAGLAEYSGEVYAQRKLIAAHGEGQFLKLGARLTVDGFSFAIQHMSVAPKLGRLVT